jgi:hypothetical protein
MFKKLIQEYKAFKAYQQKQKEELIFDKNLNCELKDIKQAIKKYHALNSESTIVFGFITLKDTKEVCEDCGENHCQDVDFDKSSIGAVGHVYDLRFLLNNIRDLCEDDLDEEGFVSNI